MINRRDGSRTLRMQPCPRLSSLLLAPAAISRWHLGSRALNALCSERFFRSRIGTLPHGRSQPQSAGPFDRTAASARPVKCSSKPVATTHPAPPPPCRSGPAKRETLDHLSSKALSVSEKARLGRVSLHAESSHASKTLLFTHQLWGPDS